MPQAYLVVWCNAAGNRHVLLATKRVLGARFNGAPAVPTLLNGAGQACFPGGGIGVGETPRQAARREFLEETGIDILSPPAIALYNVQGNHLINSGAGAPPGNQYSTLYVQLANLLDLQNLSNAINVNIGANAPLDDELNTTQVVAEGAVNAMLGPIAGAANWYGPPRMVALNGAFQVRGAGAWHNIGPGFVLPARRAFVHAKLNAPHGWFQTMIANLNMAAAAAALAHGLIPGGPVLAVAPVLPPVAIGALAPVGPPGQIGPAIRRALMYGAVIALGAAVTINYLMPYLFPGDKQN